jgi:hypothetical protein
MPLTSYSNSDPQSVAKIWISSGPLRQKQIRNRSYQEARRSPPHRHGDVPRRGGDGRLAGGEGPIILLLPADQAQLPAGVC